MDFQHRGGFQCGISPVGESRLSHNTHFCSWSFCSLRPHLVSVGATRKLPAHYGRFFRALGHRIRTYRTDRHLTQEDMIAYGFSLRHWQMMEAGRPITLFTLLRVCETFEISPERLMNGLAVHLHPTKSK